MPSIDEIISTKDLESLFQNAVKGDRGVGSNKAAIIRRIRAFAPLSFADIEGTEDNDVMAELEKCGRWSILQEIKRNTS